MQFSTCIPVENVITINWVVFRCWPQDGTIAHIGFFPYMSEALDFLAMMQESETERNMPTSPIYTAVEL